MAETIADWLDLLTQEAPADRAAFAKLHPSPLLVALENDTSQSGQGIARVENDVGTTEMLDPGKIKSGALASRDARVWTVTRRPPNTTEIVVGRARECDVWIDDTRVSKKHAAFAIEKSGFVLFDLGSTNGTFVNDRKLDKGERAQIRGHDQVRFGRAMKMHFMEPEGFFEYLNLLKRFGI
jgi:hypothetical protein